MKKVISVFALALTVGGTACAQNSLFYKAQGLLEENKLLEAEKVIETSLTSGKTKKLARAYNLAAEIQARKLQKEILKAAKSMPLDTALFVQSLNKAYKYYTESHKIDITPDKKGRVKPELVQKNKERITHLAPDFIYAAQFLYKNKELDGAYNSYVEYLKFPENIIYSKHETDSIYKKNRAQFSKVAYFAAMIGYQKKDWDKVLPCVDIALKDSSNLKDLYVMKFAALLSKKDTASWVETNIEAIRRVDDCAAFIQNLLYYYNSQGKNDEALKMGNEFVAQDSKNKMSWYARGCVYLNLLKDYKAARADFMKALEIDSLFPEAVNNVGVSYINEVVSMRDKITSDPYSPKYKKDREMVLEFYRKALPYFEKFRELCPDKPRVWANNLRNIYYNLNEKEKEKEMDAIAKKEYGK